MSRSSKTKPTFTEQFPPKSIWVGDAPEDSIELTFSSLEEAEWKLLEEIPCRHFFEAFGKVLSSDPSSMDYPFNLLCQENMICAPLVSEDGLVRFIGVVDDFVQQPPAMLVQYKIGGDVRVAGVEMDDARYYRLSPSSVYTFKKENSTFYYVLGHSDYKCTWRGSKMCAYELEGANLHPAFVYKGKDASSCITDDYFDLEGQVSEAIHYDTLTKEECCHFLCLSDEMFAHSRYANILARAAVRHQLAACCMEERNLDESIFILQHMIEELLDATRKFGPNADWDEYLMYVPEILCHHYNVKGDAENLKKYAAIAKEAKKRCKH